jgi:hypothetical protein
MTYLLVEPWRIRASITGADESFSSAYGLALALSMPFRAGQPCGEQGCPTK